MKKIALVLCLLARAAYAQAPSPAPTLGSPPGSPPSTAVFPEANAPKVPPELRISITSLLAARYNPLGLEEQLRIGLQQRIYHSFDVMFRDNFVFLGIHPKLSPAFSKVGPSLEIQPLSMFNLRATLEFVYYFSTFDYLQSYSSPRAEYSDSQIDRGGLAGRNYSTDGIHFMLEPLVQVKFGPIALRNRFSIEYWGMHTKTGDSVWYDPTLDTLVPANGWVYANDLDLLYVSKKRFVVGVRYSTVLPLYRDSDFAPGEPRAHNNEHHRLGPLVAYTFFDRGYTRFNKPSLVLILNWYADHRYRLGADVHPGIPYVVLAFAFTSDIILR